MPDESEIRRVLVVTAHPDDVDFGAAGTVATWTDAGIEVTYATVTSGEAGEAFPDTPRTEVGALREAEQIAAAKCVGVTDVRFLHWPDGRLTPSLELRRDISRVIRQVRPDRILIPSAELDLERIYASHPDHRAVGEAAIAAVYPDARNPWAHTELLRDEGLEPWTVPETWVMATKNATEPVDITDVFDRKIAALQAHASQIGGHQDLEGMLRNWGSAVAQKLGLEEGRIAEAFQVVNTR
ncbi:MAG: PIG-L domain-containing protein [Catenulispora sp. 13_1_20CM_3_70_7]|jgi:LmbE family N-acetylglucosaminyl deacetylase|nr:PIG-L family deacetylase [Catenulisporales bacterium]OLE21828.1 MAG: PIG-L domain-containing protein [Catenulispora sp. 13_1_20CM_3_70_7]